MNIMAPRPKTGPIDMAEAWIIQNPTATYRDAAMMFGLTHNNVRARISNKYGSLAEARMAGPELVGRDPRRVMKPIRRCIRCGVSDNIDQGKRICHHCHEEIEALESCVDSVQALGKLSEWADARMERRRIKAAQQRKAERGE